MADTDPRAFAAQVAVVRRLGPSGRVSMAADMSDAARRIAIDGELRRHPELSEEDAWWIVCRRTWGAALAARVRRPR